VTAARQPAALTSKTLGLVRVAMLAGVLAFGASIWFMRRTPGSLPPSTATALTFRPLLMVVWAATVVGTLAAFFMARRPIPAARRYAVTVVGWALGEAAALSGGVYYLSLGDPQWYFSGLLALLLTYAIFPVPPARS
jgi:hypothetical protein